MEILTSRHPSDLAVAQIVAEFANIFKFMVENAMAPINKADMWWKDLSNASFPAITVSAYNN